MDVDLFLDISAHSTLNENLKGIQRIKIKFKLEGLNYPKINVCKIFKSKYSRMETALMPYPNIKKIFMSLVNFRN
jgi:hypothetical protein